MRRRPRTRPRAAKAPETRKAESRRSVPLTAKWLVSHWSVARQVQPTGETLTKGLYSAVASVFGVPVSGLAACDAERFSWIASKFVGRSYRSVRLHCCEKCRRELREST